MMPGDAVKRKRQPRKPQISPTKIRTYLECPLMYKFIYIDRIGRFHYTPNIGDSFGSSLHRALQDFHASGGPETQTSEQLADKLRSTWVGVGYASTQEESEHLDTGMKMLEEYYASLKPEAVTLFTERQLKIDMGNFFLIGRIDRLDERVDGVLEIVDYKTGRSSVTQEQVSNDLAMSIYQLLVKKNYPGKRAMATIHCLRTGVSASAELSEVELTDLEQMVIGVAEEMLSVSGDTVIDPERKPICDGCNFFKICTRKARIAEIDWSV